jgi:hypothetical protein
LTRAAAIVAALALLAGLPLGGTAEGKKKKKGGGAANLSKTVESGIPDAVSIPPNEIWGRLQSTITVGKKFTGESVGDLKVTYQTTGANPGSAADLLFRLTAPNGRTVDARPAGSFTGPSIGPLTVTANSPVAACGGGMGCALNPQATLMAPYAGTAGNPDLVLFNGLRMRGNWTLSVLDADVGETSVLNSWRLSITPAKPPKGSG